MTNALIEVPKGRQLRRHGRPRAQKTFDLSWPILPFEAWSNGFDPVNDEFEWLCLWRASKKNGDYAYLPPYRSYRQRRDRYAPWRISEAMSGTPRDPQEDHRLMLYQGHHRPAAKLLTDGQPLHGLKHKGGDAAGGPHRRHRAVVGMRRMMRREEYQEALQIHRLGATRSNLFVPIKDLRRTASA